MLALDDPRWATLEGGYKLPIDVRPLLARLDEDDETAWDELWEELHHQGDVGLASYAAVPYLVASHRRRDEPNWQTYSLISTIEDCRRSGRNPPLPDWLEHGYWTAWHEVVELACKDLSHAEDEDVTRAALGAIAFARALPTAGALVSFFGETELAEALHALRG